MPPTTDLQIVPRDLRDDADHWETISEELNRALAEMDGSCHPPYGLFDGISHALGATSSYKSALDQMITFLRDGVNETANIARRLRETAEDAERTDAEAAS